MSTVHSSVAPTPLSTPGPAAAASAQSATSPATRAPAGADSMPRVDGLGVHAGLGIALPVVREDDPVARLVRLVKREREALSRGDYFARVSERTPASPDTGEQTVASWNDETGSARLTVQRWPQDAPVTAPTPRDDKHPLPKATLDRLAALRDAVSTFKASRRSRSVHYPPAIRHACMNLLAEVGHEDLFRHTGIRNEQLSRWLYPARRTRASAIGADAKSAAFAAAPRTDGKNSGAKRKEGSSHPMPPPKRQPGLKSASDSDGAAVDSTGDEEAGARVPWQFDLPASIHALVVVGAGGTRQLKPLSLTQRDLAAGDPPESTSTDAAPESAALRMSEFARKVERLGIGKLSEAVDGAYRFDWDSDFSEWLFETLDSASATASGGHAPADDSVDAGAVSPVEALKQLVAGYDAYDREVGGYPEL